MQTSQRYKSTRNGFAVASILLFGFLALQFIRQGEWSHGIGTVFFLSQTVFWASWAYYSR